MLNQYSRSHPLIDSSDYDPEGQERLNQIISSNGIYNLNKFRLNILLTEPKFRRAIFLTPETIADIPYQILITKDNKAFVLYDRILGKGSFSRVLLAIDVDTCEHVAIKMQIGSTNTRQDETILAVIKESRILKKLNLLIDQSTFYHNGNYYIFQIQKLAWGNDFFDIIESYEKNNFRQVPLVTKLNMAYGAINKIIDLHNHNILHLDIKLENFIYDEANNTVALVDFGFSRIGQSIDNTLKVFKKILMGTPEYLAPEIISVHYFNAEDDAKILNGKQSFPSSKHKLKSVTESKNYPIEYNIATEMYAFGILLVYIFSDYFTGHITSQAQLEIYKSPKKEGIIPQLLMNAPDVLDLQFVCNEISLPLKNLYSLIQRAVDLNPANRPSFNEMQNSIRDCLKYIEENSQTNINLNQGLLFTDSSLQYSQSAKSDSSADSFRLSMTRSR